MSKRGSNPLLFLLAGACVGFIVYNRKKIIGTAMQTIEQIENRKKLQPYFRTAEKNNGIPTGLLERIAQQESSFLTSIITGVRKSSAGAIGLMQIVPKWHPTVNAYDPIDSINYAGTYLKSLYKALGNDWKKALAAYNWGIANVQKYGIERLPTETKNYVEQITHDIPV